MVKKCPYCENELPEEDIGKLEAGYIGVNIGFIVAMVVWFVYTIVAS